MKSNLRLHVVSLPHTQTTKDYSACAYTEKVRKFCNMMTDRGDTVFLYAGEENEARCGEHICCISREKQKKLGFENPDDYLKIDFNALQPWAHFNSNLVKELQTRLEPHDIICVITGEPTRFLAEQFPTHLIVEFGVGYSGICHKYRVFESYAWRNYVYGKYGYDGHFFDEVIPNYWELSEFPQVRPWQREDYFLYIGRLTEKKGWRIAQEVCQKLAKRLIVAGPGNFDGYGEYVGVVGPRERGELMSKAKAVFVPTLYVGPFEGVHIEANLCGTPVITTDFGVFTETVVNGVNGYRCKIFEDFLETAWGYSESRHVNYSKIRNDAQAKYSLEVVGSQYEAYFKRLLTLWQEGWYTISDTSTIS